jgi:effector-binding domain-containing protein
MMNYLSSEPVIVSRPEQPYAGIMASVPMQGLNQVADRIPEVFRWLADRGVEPAGAPFFKYNVIDMARELEVEVGVPVARPVAGDGEIIGGVLPAGRYATVAHVGHPQQLIGATGALLDWAAQQGLEWDMMATDAGEKWACRVEFYVTDPKEEPDMNKWTTELVFKLAD